MKIVFMGTPNFSVPILKMLHEDYGVSLVVTQPDKLVGRKKKMMISPVKETALELGIKVFQPNRIKNDYEPILEAKPDLIITAAYGQIIPDILLETPRLKAINVHASLLPKYRGGAPIQRAIMNQETLTGITIMYMSSKMDAGDIITQASLTIEKRETSESLFNKLSMLGTTLLKETLPSIINETNPRIPQNVMEVTYAPTIKPTEELLDFDQSAPTLDAKIRAFYKEPNTYTFIENTKLKVIEATYHDDLTQGNVSNGTIIKIDKTGIYVKCERGTLILTIVQLESKNAMPVKDFMNGAGRKLLSEGLKLGH
jgi:methionyl-tRNA formyltransferase